MTTENTQEIVVSSWQGGKTDIDNAMDAFIKETQAKFTDIEDKNEQSTERNEVSAGAASEITPEQGTEGSPNTVEEPKQPEDRGLERLVEREVALRSRESALEARERAMADVEARIKALESRALPEDMKNRWEYDPENAMKAMGLDPDMVVRQVIASRLGKDAPPEVQNTLESARIKKEMSELRNQLFEHQRMIAAQQYVAQVQSGARTFITSGLGQDVPTVAGVAKTNPERVYREIMEEISKDAASRAHAEPNGNVLPYEEAAKRVEARWAEFKALMVPTAAPNQSASQPQTGTTGNAPAQKPTTTPPVTPQIKPPERPIAPWLQKQDIEDEGIRAGLAAYKKAQG